MKKLISILCCVLLIALAVLFRKPIINTIKELAIYEKKDELIIPDSNKYKKNISYLFMQETDNFIPNNRQELINIIYTMLDNGWETFTFYCGESYESCIDDIYEVSNNNVLLTNINNYVNPYNSYKTIKVSYDNTGEVTFTTEKLYLESQIITLENTINDYINTNITPDMTVEDKIKLFHDYIINKTKYDTSKVDVGLSEYNSSIAYGPIINGFGVCGGYSDAMAIFLNKLNINNFKIASEDHVWNAIYLNGEWLHLDLTWDDPVDENGQEYLIHKYFLITTEALHTLDKKSHNFDPIVYLEFK